ncbi:hypothetical protein Nepgr_012002 [Nepenthes gracilis]|uniref:Uncharacterized protein n=1 Tax=Nepenthes gracilis TaxID=150966 RepID=A0AAD3SG75_NEPGR|nr:hypothetical protein Nepgr_012002 [Nepenthes gracilis]
MKTLGFRRLNANPTVSERPGSSKEARHLATCLYARHEYRSVPFETFSLCRSFLRDQRHELYLIPASFLQKSGS